MNSTKKPYIVKVFEACTSHITKKDDKLLRKEDLAELSVYQVKGGDILFGYLIYTGLEDNTSINEQIFKPTKDAILKAGFSENFVSLLNKAKKNGCKFLQLDCEGVEYEDLQTFDW
jgi:hypothetical protein